MMRMVGSSPQHREVACAIIIDTCGRFLLQQRDDIVGILLPGGAVWNAVGIRCGAFSGNMKVSFHAARSIG